MGEVGGFLLNCAGLNLPSCMKLRDTKRICAPRRPARRPSSAPDVVAIQTGAAVSRHVHLRQGAREQRTACIACLTTGPWRMVWTWGARHGDTGVMGRGQGARGRGTDAGVMSREETSERRDGTIDVETFIGGERHDPCMIVGVRGHELRACCLPAPYTPDHPIRSRPWGWSSSEGVRALSALRGKLGFIPEGMPGVGTEIGGMPGIDRGNDPWARGGWQASVKSYGRRPAAAPPCSLGLAPARGL